MSEHHEQVTLFEWLYYNRGKYPVLQKAFAIPNGGLRNKVVAGKLKAEGVKSGVPDLMLPTARKGKHGLFIEMKAKNGKTSVNQKKWILDLLTEGYSVQVCFGSGQAINTIIDYLSLPERMKVKE